jgi:tetratricopeptide (TPR) repeat protein
METGKGGQSDIKNYSFKRLLLIFILPAISILYLPGQTSYKDNIYNAFISGRMDLWEYNMNKMEQEYLRDKNILTLYDLTYTMYGYIAYCIATGNKDKGRYYLNKARKNVNTLLKYHSSQAEIHSLKGAMYGFEIGLNPLKAIDYGIKSIKSIDRAVELDKNNARVLMELGNLKYYTPKILGGGLKKAIYYHEKAVSMFELSANELKGNWLYLLVLTNLGRWYSEDQNFSKAREVYRKILDIEPNYLWVKNYLYPDLAKQR